MMETGNSPDEECWEYLDPNSVKRGPFPGSRMQVWYDHEMLPEELRVRYGSSMPFIPIRELFHPPMKPFRSRPRLTPPTVTPPKPAPAAKPAQPPPAQPPRECSWQYMDTKGQLQGPFSSAQMALWHEHGMLPKSLRLRRTTDTAFGTITEYFPSPMVPFKSAPETPGASKEAPATAPAPSPAPQRAPATPGRTQPQAAGAVTGPGFSAGVANLFASAAAAAAASHQSAVSAQASATKPQKGEKAKGKGRHTQHEEETGGEQPGGKKGRGKASKEASRQQESASSNGGWTWSAEHGWVGPDGKNLWSGWSWNGWSEEGWEQSGKHGGAEWKGEGAPIGAGPQHKEKGEKASAAVQAAFGNLKWGPPFEDADLFPEEPIRRVLDEGIVWEERWISPLAVRFSQGKIHPFFHERGPISEVMLQIKLNSQDRRRIDPPFPPIRLLHLKEQGVLVTLDNRRLYALQRFALQEWPQPLLVKALCVDELTPTRLRAENRKFTNRLCGLQLEVESRSNAFDTFSWVTEAAHVEAARFCRPASLRAYDKAVSLLPALVVHALLCKSLRPLLRARWPGLCYLATILPNPQRREFASKRVLMQHVLELSKPSCKALPCPRVCVAYKAETVVSLSKGRSCVSSKLSVQKPLALLQAPGPLSDVQRRVLATLMPMFCLPYARSVLRGSARDWVVGFLLAWGKVAAAKLELELP